MLRDGPVKYRGEDEIAATVDRLRRNMEVAYDGQLDIVDLIRRCVGLNFGKEGVLSLDIFVKKNQPYPAYVTFDPLVMHIEEEIWEHARIGDPISRFILAHELGHAVLHDRTARPFSGKDTGFGLFGFNECSAEWQADTFAEHLLAPDWISSLAASPRDITLACNIEERRAEVRLQSVKRRRLWQRRDKEYWGEACPECANFTLVRNGTCLKCETCGAATGCS